MGTHRARRRGRNVVCRRSARSPAPAGRRCCATTAAWTTPWPSSHLLVTAGDNPDRLRSEAAFARLCGAAPIPVSSGRTDRHRLHRGGDRDATSALWRVALVRMRCHQPTKDYVARRITEDKTKTEIMRCLERYIARETFHLLAGAELTRHP